MRYAITAISRKGGRTTANSVCTFLRQCKTDFEALTHHSRDLSKKQRVTVESLHKIEDGGSHRLTKGHPLTRRVVVVAYAVAIRCYEYDLPNDMLDDIVSRTLDANHNGEPRGKQGEYADFGYY